MATQTQAEADTGSTFEQQVNDTVSLMTKDEKGIYQFAEGEIPDNVRYAANAERRRRSTESALSKARLQLKAQEEVSDKLKQKIVASSSASIPAEEKEQLEELMYSDPKAWRLRMNELEQSTTTSLNDEISAISSDASQQAELGARQQILDDFNARHPDVPITEDVVANDVPPRITKKLENGEITFAEFLRQAHDYIITPKKVGGTSAGTPTNLGEAGGSASPSGEAFGDSANSESYSNAIF